MKYILNTAGYEDYMLEFGYINDCLILTIFYYWCNAYFNFELKHFISNFVHVK